MKQRLIKTIAALVILFFALTVETVRISAQQPTPTLVTPTPTPTPAPDLEGRIYKLEAAQTQTIRSLELINENNRAIILGVGGLIAVLVAVQSLATGIQLRREGRREERQVSREEERDRIDRAGVEQVSKIMNVVQQTLESRLDAEKQARKEVEEARKESQEVLKQVKSLERFYNSFQATIRNSRQNIEELASDLAQTSRHHFKRKPDELASFVRQFDAFKTGFEALEEEPRPFSARVPYICGIAALYANQPEIAKQCLEEVVRSQEPVLGEPKPAHNRRGAIAYYYHGLIESNFNNPQRAIDSFEEANRRDLQRMDFLTRIVTAEAYVMTKNFDMAEQFINEVEDGLRQIESKEGRLRNHQLRLRSRAALIRANIAILRRDANWREEVQRLLEPVHVADPQYYYATATLAQVCAGQGDPGEAKVLFREAYDAIERSGDLLTVIEARSKILLLMVAGMCCKHGLSDEKRSEDHLDRADDLRSSLPRIGSQVCTVFSPLSKRNEGSTTIRDHIEVIRNGHTLLKPDR